MPLTIEPETPPLRVDESGTIRVGKTRIILEVVVQAYQQGETPEGIVDMYETLELAEVYAVIAYYLRHQAEVEAYLANRNREADELRKQIEEAQRHLPDLRGRVLAARKK